MILMTDQVLIPEQPNGKAVLLIHGWTGFPDTVLPLGWKLQEEGFYVYIPILSGHGCDDPDDFASAKSEHWENDVNRSYSKLLEKFDRKNVYVAGLSMGALLTLKLAHYYSIPKIALLAPALDNRDWMIWLTPIIQLFAKYWKNEKVREDNIVMSAAAERLEREVYGAYTWASPAFQLLKLQLNVKSVISSSNLERLNPNAEIPKNKALIVWAKDDEAVPESAPRKIYECLQNVHSRYMPTLKILETGFHVLPIRSKQAVDEVVAFFR